MNRVNHFKVYYIGNIRFYVTIFDAITTFRPNIDKAINVHGYTATRILVSCEIQLLK